MYAVIKTGGKQYRIAPGQTFRVEKLEGQVGDVVQLDNVLLVSDGDQIKVGKPLLEGAAITAQIVEQDRGKKIVVFKKRRRKSWQKTKGHRQYYTALKVQAITV
jgi:large subunit ribosomal protein L21